jgi:hypothetical protein
MTQCLALRADFGRGLRGGATAKAAAIYHRRIPGSRLTAAEGQPVD